LYQLIAIAFAEQDDHQNKPIYQNILDMCSPVDLPAEKFPRTACQHVPTILICMLAISTALISHTERELAMNPPGTAMTSRDDDDG
jgi:hypothetical protein